MEIPVPVSCPKCGLTACLRHDPRLDEYAVQPATRELGRECPDHTATQWAFWDARA